MPGIFNLPGTNPDAGTLLANLLATAVALDVVVGIAMVALVGWHWAFVPAFLAELVPLFDLVPSWTAAVLIATRNTAGDPGPLPVATDRARNLPPRDGPAGPPQLPSA
jgi:hypothetical protein